MLPWFIPPTSIISNTSLSYNSFISYSFSWWEKRQLGLHTHWLNIFVPSYLTFFFGCNYSLCRAVWEACSLSFWINKSWIWKEKKKKTLLWSKWYIWTGYFWSKFGNRITPALLHNFAKLSQATEITEPLYNTCTHQNRKNTHVNTT